MFEQFDLTRLSEYTFYVIFVVVLLGAGVFNLILMRQISLMNRVFHTPWSGFFSFMAFAALCVVGGLLVFSVFYLIP